MTDLAILAVILGISILVLVVIIEILRKRVLTPSLSAFLSALEPYAQEAISGVEKLATDLYKKTGEFLAGDVKKALADDFYTTLPESITIGGRTFPIGFVKVIVTKERWSAFIQDIFDKGDAKLMRNKDWLLKKLAALRVTVDELDGEVDLLDLPDAIAEGKGVM
jgi:hypothetical protein